MDEYSSSSSDQEINLIQSKCRGVYSPRSGWTIYVDGKKVEGYFAHIMAEKLEEKSVHWIKKQEERYTLIIVGPSFHTADVYHSFDEAVTKIKEFLELFAGKDIDEKEVLKVFNGDPEISPRFKEWCWEREKYKISLISPR